MGNPLCPICHSEMTIERELKTVIIWECKRCNISEGRLKRKRQ